MSDHVLAFAEFAQTIPTGIACLIALLALTAIPLAASYTWPSKTQHEGE